MMRTLAWTLHFSIILDLVDSAAIMNDVGRGPKKCQYDMCNPVKPGVLNVHIVAHTHDDVGWLKTVDQYYYGTRPNIQRAYVKQILDSVINELIRKPHRKFIYAEMAFFSKWWSEQSETMKELVRGLVNRGQLQFICGGWSMNDEAATHYNAIIDQHTLGFRFLEDTFGECARPRVGWQIDPFGHSREQASIFARFGFDGLFLGRIDQQDKDRRMAHKEMEMMWDASSSLGEQAYLFTSITFDGYYPPKGFCFDKYCSDPEIKITHPYANRIIDQRVAKFINFVKNMSKYYDTNNVLVTMGGDFHYENATKSFENLDNLITLVNQRRSDVNLIYSTPQCYLQAVNEAVKVWPKKTDDFFPYAHKPTAYWTGYFTSRPTYKGYIRTSNNFFQVCKQLDAFAQLGPEYQSAWLIQQLAEALGDAQHHDAATGTAKQHVANDYNRLLSIGVRSCEKVVNFALSNLVAKASFTPETQRFCQLSNVSSCTFTEILNHFTVIVYNPVARPTDFWVRIPVTKDSFVVTLADASPVRSMVIPLSERTLSIPERSRSQASGELVFQTTLPPLGFNTYFVSYDEYGGTSSKEVVEEVDGDFFIENKHIRANFDGRTGMISSINLRNGLGELQLSQQFRYYVGHSGYGTDRTSQTSGAYVFRPVGISQPLSYQVKISKVNGLQVQEVWQTVNEWVSQVIRLYEDAQYLEFEWTVGPIPIDHDIGKEIVTVFTSDLNNYGTFYTDSNGREMMERRNGYRPTWFHKQTGSMAEDYYPVNSRIFIRDEEKGIQMTVLTDRSQGGGSPADGSIELMIHRRLLRDDGLGVGEPLNETGLDGKGLIARGKHYLLVNAIAEATRVHRDMAEKLFMSPAVSFAKNSLNLKEYSDLFITEKSYLTNGPLPENIHLLTLQNWREKSILVRVEHMYEAEEDLVLSKPVTVQLKNLFTDLEMISLKELTLGANMPLEECKRLVWSMEDYGPTQRHMAWLTDPVDGENWDIMLYPMEIRTFEINLG